MCFAELQRVKDPLQAQESGFFFLKIRILCGTDIFGLRIVLLASLLA